MEIVAALGFKLGFGCPGPCSKLPIIVGSGPGELPPLSFSRPGMDYPAFLQLTPQALEWPERPNSPVSPSRVLLHRTLELAERSNCSELNI